MTWSTTSATSCPTRERLGRCYGSGFADLVFDEVLPSFPSEHRHHAFGVDEARLLANVYPWFFPRAAEAVASGDESRAFHDQLRGGITQEILYPARGGFGGFAAGFADKLDRDGIDVRTGVGDIDLEVQPGTHRVEWVEAGGPAHPGRALLLGAGVGPPVQSAGAAVPGRGDRPGRRSAAFGSTALRTRRTTRSWSAIPGSAINRVHFPDELRGTDEPPDADRVRLPSECGRVDAGRRRVARSVARRRARVGLLDEDHQVEEFDFRSFQMHFNAFGAEGRAAPGCRPLVAGSSEQSPSDRSVDGESQPEPVRAAGAAAGQRGADRPGRALRMIANSPSCPASVKPARPEQLTRGLVVAMYVGGERVHLLVPAERGFELAQHPATHALFAAACLDGEADRPDAVTDVDAHLTDRTTHALALSIDATRGPRARWETTPRAVPGRPRARIGSSGSTRGRCAARAPPRCRRAWRPGTTGRRSLAGGRRPPTGPPATRSPPARSAR